METCGNLWKPEEFGVNFQNFSVLLLWMVVGWIDVGICVILYGLMC